MVDKNQELLNDRKILLPSELTRQKDLYKDLTQKKMEQDQEVQKLMAQILQKKKDGQNFDQLYKKYDEARKMREIYAKEAALEIKKQFCTCQNYIKMIDKNIDDMEEDKEFIKEANIYPKDQNHSYYPPYTNQSQSNQGIVEILQQYSTGHEKGLTGLAQSNSINGYLNNISGTLSVNKNQAQGIAQNINSQQKQSGQRDQKGRYSQHDKSINYQAGQTREKRGQYNEVQENFGSNKIARTNSNLRGISSVASNSGQAVYNTSFQKNRKQGVSGQRGSSRDRNQGKMNEQEQWKNQQRANINIEQQQLGNNPQSSMNQSYDNSENGNHIHGSLRHQDQEANQIYYQQENDEEKCAQCDNKQPPDHQGDLFLEMSWIGCSNESCNRWFHQSCLGMSNEDYKQKTQNNEEWYCHLCPIDQQKNKNNHNSQNSVHQRNKK